MNGGFINYDLMNDIERVIDAGVLNDFVDDKTNDERHLSELYRIVSAMDDKEVYTVIKSIVAHHRLVLVTTLEKLNEEEGEKNGRNQRNQTENRETA